MAAGLGFKTFTTGDVLTAGDTNGYLMQGVLVFASSAARASAITSPQEGQYSYLKDTNSTEYYTGSAWVAAGGGGGKVLQVVQGTYATATSITSTTYTDSGLTATITPTLNTSKVLVLVSMPCWLTPLSGTPSQVAGWLKIVRGATDISTITTSNTFGIGSSSGSMQFGLIAGMNYLDSPATTSATTYKLQGAQQQSTDLLQFCRGSSQSTIILMEIGA